MTTIELIGIFGGAPAISAGIAYFVSKRIFLKWEHSKQAQLEVLKSELSHNKELINNLLHTNSSGFNYAQESRIESIKVIWTSILKIKEMGSAVRFLYNVLSTKEIEEIDNNELLKNNEFIKNDLERIRKQQKEYITNIAIIEEDVEKQRPFINENIWFYFIAYKIFIGRSMILMSHPILKSNKHWTKDDYTIEILKKALTPEEIDYAKSLNFNSLAAILDLVEQKILVESNKILSGELAMEHGLAQVKKITEMLGKEQSLTKV